jgi:hypothetical protein
MDQYTSHIQRKKKVSNIHTHIYIYIYTYTHTHTHTHTHRWSEKFSALTINGSTIGKIFSPKLVHLT